MWATLPRSGFLLLPSSSACFSAIYEKTGNNFVIAVPFETVNFKYDTISEEDKQSVALKVKDALLSDMFQSMLKAYGDDLSIEIDYKRAGFSE